MIVEIKRVIIDEPSDIEEFNNDIYGISESGIEIHIETSENVSELEHYINKKVDILLFINHLVIDALKEFLKNGYPLYEGELLGKFKIESEWKHTYDYRKIHLIGIGTQEGILLTSKWACDREKIKIGEKIKFTTYSYNIVAWSPIE
jgi:hypothetical protein